jgi:peroxiredoxin
MKRAFVYFAILIAGLPLTACDDDDSESSTDAENTVNACFDEADNDGDGLVDCLDSDCQIYVGCQGVGHDPEDHPAIEDVLTEPFSLPDCDEDEEIAEVFHEGPWAVGEAAPNFRARTYDGKKITLSCLLKKGPVVLEFMNAFICPFCNVHLVDLQESGEAFWEADIPVVLVAWSDVDDVKNQWEKVRDMSRFYGIGEPDHDIGILYHQFTVDEDLLPAQFLIGPDGVIRFAHYMDRIDSWASTADMFEMISEL